MSNVTFQPFTPSGTIQAPPSKSDVHRAVICAALSGGVCTISPVALSEDIRATIGCAQALGASVRLDGDVLTVDGSRMFENRSAVLDCRESGSTLRFFIPVAAAGGIDAVFTGSGRLPERPIGIYTDALPEKGVTCVTEGGLPLRISGRLQSGVYHIPGDVSSQFITGLLFALPLLSGDSDILLTSPVQSAGYINMTIRTMSKFGIEIDMTDKGWHIRGKQHYIPTDYTTDGDWSQAAFFLTAAAVGGEVTVNGCNIDSSQGDRRIAALLRAAARDHDRRGADPRSGACLGGVRLLCRGHDPHHQRSAAAHQGERPSVFHGGTAQRPRRQGGGIARRSAHHRRRAAAGRLCRRLQRPPHRDGGGDLCRKLRQHDHLLRRLEHQQELP